MFTIKTGKREILAKKSEKVSLKCEFSGGRPKPLVSWMFNGALIESNQNKKYYVDKNTLEIRNATKTDSGIYTCILSNGYHTQQQFNLTLKVFGNN